MKEKRMLRLINDERTLLSVKKTSACDTTAADGGCSSADYGECVLYANDTPCTIDIGRCREGAQDYCSGTVDYKDCSGAGVVDRE